MMQQLAATSIASGLSPKQLSEAAGRMRLVEAAAGQRLYSQGQPSTRVFILLRGKVQLHAERSDSATVVDAAEQRTQALLGAEAALARSNYRETAMAVAPGARLLVLPGGELPEFLRMMPGLHEGVRSLVRAGQAGSPRRRKAAASDEWTVEGYRQLINECHWTSCIMNYSEPVDTTALAKKLGVVAEAGRPTSGTNRVRIVTDS